MSILTSRDPGRSFLGVNSWDEVLWYRAEAMDEVAGWLRVVANLETWDDPEAVVAVEDALARLDDAGKNCGCRVAELLKVLATR